MPRGRAIAIIIIITITHDLVEMSIEIKHAHPQIEVFRSRMLTIIPVDLNCNPLNTRLRVHITHISDKHGYLISTLASAIVNISQ